MSGLLQVHDESMIGIRSQFNQLGWFSRLFFPSDMQRSLLRFYIPRTPRAASSTSYYAQYRADAVSEFCRNYHNFITDESFFGRFRRWLFDFLPAFNTNALMNLWRFTDEHKLEEDDEFAVLVSNLDTDAFQSELLIFKQAMANDDSQTLRGVYARYLTDIVIRSPMPGTLEGFAGLLVACCNKGLAYKKQTECYGEGYKTRQNMFETFRTNPPVFTDIIASLERLNPGIHFANEITIEEIIRLYQNNTLDKWVNGLNALHVQTFNASTNRSALHENPEFIKLLLKHREPESLSRGLIRLWHLGLCTRTPLLKKGETELDMFDQLKIRRDAALSTANRMTTNIKFYTRGITTEAGVERAFHQNMSEQVKLSERALQSNRKFEAKLNKFKRLTRKYQLPSTLQLSDFETSGLNVLRLAHHLHPEHVVNALSKFHFRDAALYADEHACVEGSSNGWGFALDSLSFDFFNHVKSKCFQAIYHQLLNHSEIFLHPDVLPYWEKIQDNRLSPVHFFGMYGVFVDGLRNGNAEIARGRVIDYLENIPNKQNDYSLMSETALALMFMYGEKILGDELERTIALLKMKLDITKSFTCITRIISEKFIDAETGISSTQLLALTWIALQKVFAKKEFNSLKAENIMDAQLCTFQNAHAAERFADRKSVATAKADTSSSSRSAFQPS